MAKLFDGHTNVIYQYPKPMILQPRDSGKDRKKQRDRMPREHKWILLPLIAYKVLVPSAQERELNVFQETVLKLFLSGVKTPEYIADKLLLAVELVEFIIKDLQAKELLDELRRVTPKGESELNGNHEAAKLESGYIFYDVVGNFYWDTFLFDQELNVVSSHSGEGKSRRFEFGNIGSPTRANALVLRSDLEELPPPPSNIEILQICIKHQRRMRNMRQEDHGSALERNTLPSNLEKVKFLGESKAYLAATMLYIPSTAGGGAYNWEVCHPFMGGTSSKLRASLEALKEQPAYADLKDELHQLTEAAFAVTDTERRMQASENERKADEYLVGILGEGIHIHYSLYRHMIELYELSAELSSLSQRSDKSAEVVQTLMSEYIDSVYRLLSEALFEAKVPYQDYFKSGYLTGDVNRNAETLGLFASGIGFRRSAEGMPQPHILHVSKGQVEYADEGKDLSGLLAINLLTAREIEDHPFWRLAKKVPQAIEFLDDLKIKRNSVNHAGAADDPSAVERTLYSTVEILFPRAIYVISLLFDGLTFRYDRGNRPKITFAVEGDLEDDTLDQRFYLLSEAYVKTEAGAALDDFTTLRRALIDTKFALLSRKQNFLVNCSKVLEELLGLWADAALDAGVEAVVRMEMKENIAYLGRALADLGVSFEATKLPDSFKNVKAGKIKKAFRNFHKSVLSARTYAFAFSLLAKSPDLLKDLGREAPEFLHFCAEISDLRGHGNRPLSDGARREELTTQLFDYTKTMMKMMRRHVTLRPN